MRYKSYSQQQLPSESSGLLMMLIGFTYHRDALLICDRDLENRLNLFYYAIQGLCRMCVPVLLYKKKALIRHLGLFNWGLTLHPLSP